MATLNQAIATWAHEFGLPAVDMLAYARQDETGGFPEKWPGGSIWDGEGRLLYALVRATGARKVLEFGTGHGCATSHLARALKDNGEGVVVTLDTPDSIDIASYAIAADLEPLVVRILEDGLAWARRNDSIDFDVIFEDGPHTVEFTREAAALCLPRLKRGGCYIVHDVYGPHEDNVWPALTSVLPDAKRLKVDPSYCGLGYWRKL